MPKQKYYTIKRIPIESDIVNLSRNNISQCPYYKDRKFMIAICSTIYKKIFIKWVKEQVELFKIDYHKDYDDIPKSAKFIELMNTNINN